jgi:hypothetical protein
LSNDNITELFTKKDEPIADPNYNYTVTFRDGTKVVSQGYLVIGHGFYGVAQGEGVLQDVWPTELVFGIHNEGPVSTGSQLN